MVIHSEDKPNGCTICGKMFTRFSTLEEHLLIHSGDKPHKCGICGKSFARRSALIKHKRIHTRVEICNSGNCVNDNLDKCMLLNTEGKPYSCGICGNSFAKASKLKDHLVIHTNNTIVEYVELPS